MILKISSSSGLWIRRGSVIRTLTTQSSFCKEGLQKDFTNNTALITGGSRGLGFDIAKRLASCGANVIVVSRNEELLNESVKELYEVSATNNYNGLEHSFISCNLADKVSIQSILKLPKIKDVNILINCAGIMQTSLLMRTKDHQIREMIELNLTVPIILSQKLSKYMITRSKHKNIKSIINISSALAHKHSLPGTAVYSASKCGLIAFTKSFAAEVGRYGIRINAVSPGLIRGSEIAEFRDIENRFVQESVLQLPLLLVEPQEIVDSVVYLLASKNITGENIVIDNGYSL